MYIQGSSGLFLILFVLVSVSSGFTWMTNSTDDWTYQCPSGEVIQTITSVYWGNTYDRRWNFTCKSTLPRVNLTSCEWSGLVNEFRGPILYQCPNDGIIAGVASEFASNQEDRRFKFYCCFPEDFAVHACVYTPDINNLDEILSYRAPDNMYIRGISSEYYSAYERWDRWFAFNICKIDQIVLPKD